MEKLFYANSNRKTAGMTILISNKINQYIMIKMSIFQEDITTTNIYAPNSGIPKYVKKDNDRIEVKNKQFNNNSW